LAEVVEDLAAVAVTQGAVVVAPAVVAAEGIPQLLLSPELSFSCFPVPESFSLAVDEASRTASFFHTVLVLKCGSHARRRC
jgi:hypothetical protein